MSDDDLKILRGKLEDCIRTFAPAEATAMLDRHPSEDPDLRTNLQGNLISAWAVWASDPAAPAADWILHGSPAGITVDFALDGVLRPVDEEEVDSWTDLATDPELFRNYASVESDSDAMAIIQQYVSNGWLKSFGTHEALERFVGSPAILNRFACIVKERTDGTIKRRIIMDSKQSGVTNATRKQYRAELPRQTDLMHSLMSLLDGCQEAENVTMLVLDAADAYWQVPLDPRERRFYCSRLKLNGVTSFLAYLRTAQGSRGAPLSWTIIFGLICRMALSALRCPAVPDSQNMHVYVDDPIATIRGTPDVVAEQVSILMLTWVALGIDLAIPKGQLGSMVNWIGATFSIAGRVVTATIQQQRLDELLQLAEAMLLTNVVTVKQLRSFTGKAQSVASLLFTWRPFVHMLYGAMCNTQSRAPNNCVWRQQIEVPVRWIVAFLKGRTGNLERTLSVDTYFRRGASVVITTDASPYGLGGILEENGHITSFFSAAITDYDRQALALQSTPDCRDQQALEALAMLVALRLWASRWAGNRVLLTVRSDNVATLSLVARMQPHSVQLGVIAREMALDIASASYAPDVAEHLPGVTNVAADVLSRRLDTTKVFKLPPYLPPGLELFPPARGPGWWQSLPAGAIKG